MPDLTLEDIARQAGVSRSTVSRVVNNQPSVRPAVRQRVLDVIKSTGYSPNMAARTLVSRKSGMIGLILPRSVSSFFSDPYFPRLTQGVAQACNEKNYTLALFLVTSKNDEEKIFLRVSQTGSLDGILVQSADHGDLLIERLSDIEIPLVILGRPMHAKDVSYIDVDNVNAAYQAVCHLIRLGYQRIAMISGNGATSVTIDRKEGYQKALKDRGYDLDERLIAEGDYSEVSGYLAMKSLLAARPDAVFAASDLMAIGAMRAVREAGLRIPEDVAFIGFDDLPFPALASPQLTTVRQPIYRFGFTAVEILIDQINNGILPSRRVIMDTELMIRDTCGTSRNG